MTFTLYKLDKISKITVSEPAKVDARKNVYFSARNICMDPRRCVPHSSTDQVAGMSHSTQLHHH